MLKNVAKGISFIFHPLIVTTIGLYIIFHSGTSLAVLQGEVIKMGLIIVALFTFLFPAIMLLFLYITNVINDLELKGYRERMLPLALILIMYLFTFFILRGIPQLNRAHVFFLSCAPLVLLIYMLLSRYTGLSLHMAGMGFLNGIVLILMIFFGAAIQGVFIAVIIATGLLGSSRLFLKNRNWQQVGMGFFTGFVVTISVMLVYNI